MMISIRLYKRITDGDVEFEQSHFIRTPLHRDPGIPDRSFYKNIAVALEEAVNGYTVPYNQAVEQGFVPDSSWLVPNDLFWMAKTAG